MSPVTHAIFGWLVAQPLISRKDRAMATALAVASDADGLSIVLGREAYERWHHTFGHGLSFGLAASLVAASFAHEKTRAFFLGLAAFHTHLLGDLFGSGEGWVIPYAWPLRSLDLELPSGWGWELNAWQNVVATLIGVAAMWAIAMRKGRTALEVVSVAADRKVVEAIRRRSRPKAG